MVENALQRRLVAILAADVVGFSRLTGADEDRTLARLRALRSDLIDPTIDVHNGRVVKRTGDGVIAEFRSVVDAVRCAVEIQNAMIERNAGVPPERRIEFRIGVHLGDVVEERDGDLMGDGVNIAARLEGVAAPGAICLSEDAYRQVKSRLDLSVSDLGETRLKNISEPMRIYSLQVGIAADAKSGPREEPKASVPSGLPEKPSIAVLPFQNMSGDPEQEYFADGITEDITTDLSKISVLFVVARNTAFTFKSKSVEVTQIARQLNVSHILEGSVRRAGGRVRITAQLVDGRTGGHIWAERFDRDLNDIFTLQDEISEAIVEALRLKLLPEEKKAIGQRGTDNVEAYNLYLMARQSYIVDNESDPKAAEAIIRLCRRAAEIDPNYARAWTLLALGQTKLRNIRGGTGDGGLMAAERALALDANLAEAHAVKARILTEDDRQNEGSAEIAIALRLDSESYEVNRSAALLSYRQRRVEDSIPYWEKATRLMESDIGSAAMLISCYHSIGDAHGARRAAQVTLARAEKALARDQTNGAVVSYSAYALAALGEAERTKERMDRALLIEPDNWNRRYNFACALTTYLNDTDRAIELLGPVFAKVAVGFLNHVKIDPDLDPLRDDPRFKSMVAAAEARLAEERHSNQS